MRNRPSLLAVVALVAQFGSAPEAGVAAEAPTEPGWHTVRPGETLRGITEQYLGSEDRWKENWQLNPSVANPDLLFPGQRLLVHQAIDQTVPTVRLTALSGRVERRPLPIPWDPARQDDLLIERDGIRTFGSSSTEMLFIDGTSVVLSEDSLIFLRQTGRSERVAEKKSVEIVEGQAEIAIQAADLPVADVEIVMGDAVARPRRDAGGVAQTRASRDAGVSKVMVFEGSGEVASAGTSVELPRGTGTSVRPSAPPTPPEKLLPAPVASQPGADVRLALPDPTFLWEGVPGAASYTLEVCRDPGCRELVRRVPDLPSNAWDSEPLPVARLYWRVNAVSATGLDGYPSRPVPFEVVSDRQDTEPPTGQLLLHGESVSLPRAPTIWGPAVRVEARLTDDRSGVRSWSATVNGRAVQAEALLGPWGSGAYTVAVEAVDAAGNRAEIGPVHFVVDDAAPVLELRIGRERMLEGIAAPEGRAGVVRALPPFVTRGEARGGPPAWHVLAWGNETSPLRDNFLPRIWPWEFERGFRWVSLKGRRPELLINAPGLEVPWNGGTRVLEASEYLSIAATDEHSGYVASLLIGEEAAPDGSRRRLVIELADGVGSRGVLRWDFRK